jgi:hypothetical protein
MYHNVNVNEMTIGELETLYESVEDALDKKNKEQRAAEKEKHEEDSKKLGPILQPLADTLADFMGDGWTRDIPVKVKLPVQFVLEDSSDLKAGEVIIINSLSGHGVYDIFHVDIIEDLEKRICDKLRHPEMEKEIQSIIKEVKNISQAQGVSEADIWGMIWEIM